MDRRRCMSARHRCQPGAPPCGSEYRPVCPVVLPWIGGDVCLLATDASQEHLHVGAYTDQFVRSCFHGSAAMYVCSPPMPARRTSMWERNRPVCPVVLPWIGGDVCLLATDA